MKTVSELYENLPVKITDEDIVDFLDIDLTQSIKGETKKKIEKFLDMVHKHIYYFLIYNTGDSDLKNALITTYIIKLEKPLKIALLTQAEYLLTNSNIEMFNGVIKSVNGVDFKETPDIISKIISPSVINILAGTNPNVLYAGE